MAFLTDLCLKALTPDLWALESPLIWEDADRGRITIPAGFITDLASVPHWVDAIPFLDRTGRSRRPGALHDGIYALGRIRGKDWADHTLEAACLAEGMHPRQARCYYLGVHWFGASSWAQDAREGIYGGIVSGDFMTDRAYRAWIGAGASIFSAPT